MAFSAGKQIDSTAVVAKKYVGVAPVGIIGVNPTKEELSTIFNKPIEKDPVYVTKGQDGTESIMITFYLKTDADKCNGVDTITKHTFFIEKKYKMNNAGDKVQIIDSCGNTAWATKEVAKAGDIPMNSNGPANILKGYRPAFVGEEDLTNFVKNFMSVPNYFKYENGSWVKNPAYSEDDCLCRFDEVSKWFSGNISEVKNLVLPETQRRVKVCLGIKHTDDNKDYQCVMTEWSSKLGNKNYNALEKIIAKKVEATDKYTYSSEEVKEWSDTPTDFASAPSAIPSEDAPSWDF